MKLEWVDRPWVSELYLGGFPIGAAQAMGRRNLWYWFVTRWDGVRFLHRIGSLHTAGRNQAKAKMLDAVNELYQQVFEESSTRSPHCARTSRSRRTDAENLRQNGRL